MIIECPACHTRYCIESTEVIDPSTFFECPQEGCRCVFPYSPPPLSCVGWVAVHPGVCTSIAPGCPAPIPVSSLMRFDKQNRQLLEEQGLPCPQVGAQHAAPLQTRYPLPDLIVKIY